MQRMRISTWAFLFVYKCQKSHITRNCLTQGGKKSGLKNSQILNSNVKNVGVQKKLSTFITSNTSRVENLGSTHFMNLLLCAQRAMNQSMILMIYLSRFSAFCRLTGHSTRMTLIGVEPPLELHKDLYKHGRKAYEVCNGKN